MPSEDPNWVDVADQQELVQYGVLEVVARGNVIALFYQDERIYALDGLCAHQGGPIAKGEIGLTDQRLPCVTCPWHGWQYELETGIQTVNRQPLQKTFPTKVENARVLVDLGESVGRR